MKKHPAALLALVFLCACVTIPVCACAEGGLEEPGDITPEDYERQAGSINAASGYVNADMRYDGDYAYFVSEDGTYCVTRLYRGAGEDVAVPAVLGGYPVRAIGDHTFESQAFIETVTVPEGISVIGKQAFFMCSGLRSVTVPEGVLAIGDQCFAGCYQLEDIRMPDSLEEIGEMAFLGCYALREITFGSGLKAIGSCAFHSCSVLQKVTVPSESVEIDDTAFLQCPDSLEVIYANKS